MLTFFTGPHGLLREQARKRFADLVGGALGRLVEVESVPTYGALMDLFARGGTDFAWLPPAVYARCAEDYDAQLLLCGVRARRAYFRGCLFVRNEDTATSIDDLAGARVGWVDGLSCAGYLFPRATLAERGVDPDCRFSSQRFFEDHISVVRAVDSGIIDVGATFVHVEGDGDDAPLTGTGWEFEHPRERMRALLISEPIPADTIVACSHLDRSIVQSFTKYLQGMHDQAEGRATLRELFGVERFEPGLPSRYASVKRALASL